MAPCGSFFGSARQQTKKSSNTNQMRSATGGKNAFCFISLAFCGESVLHSLIARAGSVWQRADWNSPNTKKLICFFPCIL